ncbi:MAG TPA: glycosyltransferase family 2 protein [Allosphingosinicella sp.]
MSICIATYNRAKLLRGRSLTSVLEQTYKNIEIIVVGDGCTDETAEMMAEVKDERVRFENLPQRGTYPEDPHLRWMVAGTAATNRALSLASGDFITHLDDDDEHSADRIEKLVATIQKTRTDLVYHPFVYETADGAWLRNEAEDFLVGRVTTSSILYHRTFKTLGWDPQAYRYREPGDWNRLRKIRYLGARTVRHPDLLLKHYKERNQTQT